MAIEELVTRVFQARNVAHREHLRTKSLAKHLALGDFYDGVIDIIDEIVEVYQGRYGLIAIPTIADKPVPDIQAYIQTEALWIENNRNKLAVCPAVLNRIDDLTALYLRTNYKLVNLS